MKLSPLSTQWVFSFAYIIASASYQANAGKFTDDRNVEFNFVGKPRIATRAATGGLSLYHFGMREDQITTIWGLWSIRGSDLDVNNPEAGSHYPDADPNVEEVEFLRKANNLSPGCYTNPRGCFRWDNLTILEEYRDEFDYIVYIDNGNDSGMKTVEADTGIPIVFVDTFYEYHPDCRFANMTNNDKSKCFGRSMIDIVTRIEELAVALGVDVDTDRVNKDKNTACEAAEKFTETMEKKQEEGLRVAVSINAIKKNDEGEDFFEFRTLDPIDLWVPRTLEELGMPLLHHDEGSQTLEEISTRVTGPEYFVDCPDGEISASCNSNTLYPVDFWLWDSRSYLNIIGNDIAVVESIFPDKAILAGQHWHYARNDGPLSYDAITRMLNEMTARVGAAKRLHDKTDCVDIDPKTDVTAQIGGGLDRGEYICYNKDLIQTEYLQCAASGPTSASSSTKSRIGGSSAYFALFTSVTGVFLLFTIFA